MESLQSKLLQTEIRSIAQAINSGFDSIAKIKKNYGEIQSRALVADMVVNLVQFVNVGKTMNALQVAETVKLIESYFPHLNLADLKFSFNEMKIGRYGKFYDRIDGQMILEYLEFYNHDRMSAFETQNNDKHKEIKKTESNSGFHPTVVAALRNAVGGKKPLAESTKETKYVSTGDISQRWMKQFDNLYLKFGETKGSIRFLVFGSIRYSVDMFIERKYQNWNESFIAGSN